MPPPAPDCDWCAYAATMKDGKIPVAKAAPAEGGVQCPQCSSPMVKRTGKYGEFWGCTKYPECRGTRRIP
ncbi:MAG: topoisomerase DNA-binding C4 zinc finger domain-containing protein [Planctomycetes bacterium]|nr:topoisomerase DNA-binding C4 zinc finger domain-containing protein [Planctomycetota bacterium]